MDAAGVPPGRSLAPEGERRGARRRRRPSGEPPPLPRELGRSGRIWIGLASGAGALILVAFAYSQLTGAFDRWDTAVLQRVVSVRTGWLTAFARGVDAALGSVWSIRLLRLGTIAALLGFRRWRHLFTFLASVAAVELASYEMSIFLARSRPFGVTIAGGWRGLAFPSRPVAALAVTTLGMAYALLPQGLPRSWGKRAAVVALSVLGLARIYLAVDHPTDVAAGVILGVVVPLVAFRWFTPNDVFPVTYHRGKAAHLDVSGPRGAAIREALRDQLAIDVLEVEPHRFGRFWWLHAASASRGWERSRTRAVPVRQAVRAESRPCRPLVQARADDALWRAGRRDALPVRPTVRRVRGLHPAAAARGGDPGARADWGRRDHPGARVPDRDGVLRGRERDRRGRGRRRGDRRWPPARSAPLGRGSRAP